MSEQSTLEKPIQMIFIQSIISLRDLSIKVLTEALCLTNQYIFLSIKKVSDSLKPVIIYRCNKEKGTAYFQKSLARYN
jgi:hypothetical protein